MKLGQHPALAPAFPAGLSRTPCWLPSGPWRYVSMSRSCRRGYGSSERRRGSVPCWGGREESVDIEVKVLGPLSWRIHGGIPCADTWRHAPTRRHQSCMIATVSTANQGVVRNLLDDQVKVSYAVPVGIFLEITKVSHAGNFILRATMIAAAIIVTSSSPFQIGFASAQQIDGMKPTANSAPIALYITLCLWSERRPAAMCHELPLTPGAAGPGFASMEACRDGQQEALRKWLTQAGPVFGFTAMSGDGYSPAREGKMDTRSLSRYAATNQGISRDFRLPGLA
jgi:hypothetical protein